MERQYTTDSDAYEGYVGSITPAEFVKPFDGDVTDAVNSLIEDWPWDEPVPDWLEEALERYVTDNL